MSNSSITTEGDLIEPIHSGEILMEVFIEDFGIAQNKLAVSIGGHIGASMRSCTASGASRLILRSVWRGTSGRPRSSG